MLTALRPPRTLLVWIGWGGVIGAWWGVIEGATVTALLYHTPWTPAATYLEVAGAFVLTHACILGGVAVLAGALRLRWGRATPDPERDASPPHARLAAPWVATAATAAVFGVVGVRHVNFLGPAPTVARSLVLVILALVLWVVIRAGVRRLPARLTPSLRSAAAACVVVCVAALAGVTVVNGVARRAAQNALPPLPPPSANLVLITIDTLRADHLSAYGYPRTTSPQIDAVAARGMQYMEHFANIPSTVPSHLSLFTSKYPITHGTLTTAGVVQRGPLALERGGFVTLTEYLARAGMETGAVVGAFPVKQYPSGLHPGFRTYDEIFSFSDRLSPGSLIHYYNRFHGHVPAVDNARSASDVVERGLAWLDTHKDERFFLWLHVWDPHAPYAPPADFDRFATPGRTPPDRTPRGPAPVDSHIAWYMDKYDGEIAYADHALGRVFAYLEAHGLTDSTYIILTSDHGEEFYEHGRQGHGLQLYDESVRVPLIIAGPQVAPGRVTHPTHSLDVMPTALHLLQLPIPAGLDGRVVHGAVPAGNRPLLLRNEARSGAESRDGLVQGAWKLIRSPARLALYNRRRDPREAHNRYVSDARTGAQMARTLQAETRKHISRWGDAITQPGEIEPPLDSVEERLRALGYVARPPEAGGLTPLHAPP